MLSYCDALRADFDYNAWATARLLNAATALSPEELRRDFETADHSVLGTLVHVYRAERLWLQRIRFGTPKTPWKLPEDEDWMLLVEKWPELHTEWKDFIRALEPPQTEQIIQYSDLKGAARSQPLWQILMHVVNHGTHHRGQVSGFLRVLGKTPPGVDEITFFRDRAREAQA